LYQVMSGEGRVKDKRETKKGGKTKVIITEGGGGGQLKASTR
jgi:hypothetical protein